MIMPTESMVVMQPSNILLNSSGDTAKIGDIGTPDSGVKCFRFCARSLERRLLLQSFATISVRGYMCKKTDTRLFLAQVFPK